MKNIDVEKFIEKTLYQKCVDLLPITTVDVLIFDAELGKTILFKRENNPLKDIYYSIGGRVYKNENLLNSAIRICKNEAGILINKKDLIFGGVTEEIFHNSSIEGINAHNINIFYGMIAKDRKFNISCDDQHSGYKWFKVDDQNIHPYLAQKIFTLMNNMSNSISENLL